MGLCFLPAPITAVSITLMPLLLSGPRVTTSREVHIGRSGGVGRLGSMLRFYQRMKKPRQIFPRGLVMPFENQFSSGDTA